MKPSSLKDRFYTVIFEANTPGGKAFDIALFITIAVSVGSIMLESVPSIASNTLWMQWINGIEITTTLLFSIEYVLRLWCSPRPTAYARSFYGLIDLVSTLPYFVSIIFPGAKALSIIRALRLLRIFRVLKLSRFLIEGNLLWKSLVQSARKIGVFLFTVLLITIVMGTLMYAIEGPENGFTSIPISIYWAIVTITTVGYGDISPHTIGGQFIASALMILGYAIIAVPTGIVTVDLATNPSTPPEPLKTCENCGQKASLSYAYCPTCGTEFSTHD
ncbi:MAG: hypothetical protein RL754_1196 [Bacteroidota bacterium]|jgi:voltage-gated potassium channel